jgi:hypothetical protein
MHFRFRGNNIQVVKSQPDPSSGKAKSVPIGSINRATLTMSEKLRTNCSAEDLKEIQAWVKRYQSVHELKRKHAALTLPEQLAAAREWFKVASADEARQVAEEVIAHTAALRHTLAKRGLL